MRFICLFPMVLCPVFAQIVGPVKIIVPFHSGKLDVSESPSTDFELVKLYTRSETFYWFSIVQNAEGDKIFSFHATRCIWPPYTYDSKGADFLFPDGVDQRKGCTPFTQSAAKALGPVSAELTYFYSLRVTPPATHVVNYYPNSTDMSPGITSRLAPEPPVTPPPGLEIIFLDGFSYNIVEFDLTTYDMTSSVTLPSQGRVFGIRRTATEPENEIWTAHAGTVNEISICDIGTKRLLATIPTPLDPSNTVPVNIVFRNGGEAALYAVSYYTADSSGNNGALLVFDTAKRKLISTLPLRISPVALIMAPDGLTAYLLANSGQITYYDILSNTADLTASTNTPGISGGYAGGNVFIHPDGSRLFWNNNYILSVFDLTTRKVTNQFNSGLPSTSAVSMHMSQDGSTVFMGNGAGNNVIVDTRSGNVMATFNTNGPSSGFGGLPGN